MGESVYYASADAKACKGAGAGHKSDFGDVLPSVIVFVEFVFDEF